MKLKIGLATVVGCMALAACGGGASEDNTLNADANMMTDMNAGMTDLNTSDMNADMNMTTDANAMGNMDMNAMGTTNTTSTTNTDATNTATNTL